MVPDEALIFDPGIRPIRRDPRFSGTSNIWFVKTGEVLCQAFPAENAFPWWGGMLPDAVAHGIGKGKFVEFGGREPPTVIAATMIDVLAAPGLLDG